MKCICGKRLKKTDITCQNCGTINEKADVKALSTTPQTRQEGLNKAAFIGCIVVSVLAIILFVLTI